jgi:hypothetical protein
VTSAAILAAVVEASSLPAARKKTLATAVKMMALLCPHSHTCARETLTTGEDKFAA